VSEVVLWLFEILQCDVNVARTWSTYIDTLIFNSRVSLSHQCQVTQNGFTAHMPALFGQFFVFFLLFVCLYVRVYLSVAFFCFYGLMHEINAIHSFIHSLVITAYL